MKNDLDSNVILLAYECVMRNGCKTELGKSYLGIEAFSDYDGYNVYLKGKGVELSMGFHNTYQLNYDQESNKATFLNQLNSLAK
ncbi:DUF3081 family protein [Vibrio scophthalmi]|uniref:DUF3081 domain-containing protein n=1 Tax=Vibrio scophthalmi TaxID=45658 RepID=A0A1E3WPP0_9VIBR|nr:MULTISPECIES: DUF3081 family protein [Vibrio]EGU31849.1 hypothetical protein VIBRN418_18673 [Vibrio sp. N418]MCY9801939.1 DUF3081 family protein [Vibrio scophthalmi]ODS11735.1 hypothetical protein VSF3289_02002 [Vibrio scophthalmi]